MTEESRNRGSRGPPPPAEHLAFVRPAAFPQTELILATNSSRRWQVFHERYVICACGTTDAEWRYRGKALHAQDGSLMFMEPGETHANTAVNKASDFIVLQIEPALIDSAAQELCSSESPRLRVFHAEDYRLHTAISAFSKSISQGAAILEQQSWLATCVRLLLEYTERKPRAFNARAQWQAIGRASTYLRDRYAEPVTLDQLSAVAGISRFHLVRQFTRQMGLSPHLYQMRLRVERGRSLLRADVPLATVATSLGFVDQSHFARHFKNAYGVRPGEYAWQCRRS